MTNELQRENLSAFLHFFVGIMVPTEALQELEPQMRERETKKWDGIVERCVSLSLQESPITLEQLLDKPWEREGA